MRTTWALLVLLFMLPAMAARADPAISMPAPGAGLAQWTFSNPGNYTLGGVALLPAGASLAWRTYAARDSDQGDFSRALALANVDLATRPGDVAILDTAQPGPASSVGSQPAPGQLADNYLWSGGGANMNFGTSPNLMVGYWGNPEWNRAVILFPSFPLPSNATLLEGRLELHMHTADTPDLMDVSVHRVTTPWTEEGSTWNDRDGSNPWNASGGGGDFDPSMIDVIPGIATTAGWYPWNVTSLVEGWRNGSFPNHGLIVRQANDDLAISAGRKQFFSSDAPNASLRPRLVLRYTTPSSQGTLESRILDAGSAADWLVVRWNSTEPAGTVLLVESRSGASSVVDPSWSPWSAPVPGSGGPVASPSSRYLQYRLVLFTPTNASPFLHDISVDYGQYGTPGTVWTEPFLPPGLVGWGTVTVDRAGPAGTEVSLAYSQDNGTSWATAGSGQTLSGAATSEVLLRLLLTTNSTLVTPVVRSFSIGFQVSPAGPSPAAIVGWLFLVPVALVAVWAIARRVLREPFDPTDLFLIHADGRLILRVGGEENPMADDVAASGMFTLVAKFVKDSFGGAGGTGGELRSFQVDEREVAIAKGEYLSLALVAEGKRPKALESSMNEFLRGVEAGHGPALRTWDGLRESLGGLEDDLRWYLEEGHRRARPGVPGPRSPP